jgi:hypothetical protein
MNSHRPFFAQTPQSQAVLQQKPKHLGTSLAEEGLDLTMGPALRLRRVQGSDQVFGRFPSVR